MADFPTFRQAEKRIKDAIPCEVCNCQHKAARVNVFLDEDGTLRVSHFRLSCGKVPLVSLEEKNEPVIEETEEAFEEEVEDDVFAGEENELPE